MGAFDTALRVGMAKFGQYGKLIGTGKNNGIKVYESLVNGTRTLTSVRADGSVGKIVKTSKIDKSYLQDHDAMRFFYDNSISRARLTEVEMANGEKIMNLRGVKDGKTLYQRLTKQHADGEMENLVWKDGYTGYKKENGEWVNADKLRPFKRGLTTGNAELNYTSTRPLEGGGYQHVGFNINNGARCFNPMELEAYQVMPNGASGITGYMESARPFAGGTAISRVPVFNKGAETVGIQLGEGVNLKPATYHGEFLYGARNGACHSTDNDVDRNTLSKVFQNIYNYVEKMRGCKIS